MYTQEHDKLMLPHDYAQLHNGCGPNPKIHINLFLLCIITSSSRKIFDRWLTTLDRTTLGYFNPST